ncbi:MAG TPA: hypothetical protein VFP50_13215 [Anaeromyxobacteraceae bacterium]|nr:hypothetical protein [Anaeromyxobacteraceae bacterium]
MPSTTSATSGAALAASIATDTLASLGAAVGSALAGAPAARTSRSGKASVLSPRTAATMAGKALSTAAAKRTSTARRTASAARKPATSARVASGYASTSGTKAADLAFLRDPKLSIEEKLFRFLLLVAKQTDQDLVAKMEEMKGKTAKASGGTGSAGAAGSTGAAGGAAPAPQPAHSKKKGFSLWSAAKLIMPQLGIASKLLGDSTVKGLVQQLSGPVLAAGATALGMPALAPVALQVGSQLAAFVTDEERARVGGSSGSDPAGGSAGTGAAGSTGSSGSAGSSSGATSASAGGSGVSEQVQVMELQRMIDKQKEMFSLVSNILRTMHDTRMTAINNIR